MNQTSSYTSFTVNPQAGLRKLDTTVEKPLTGSEFGFREMLAPAENSESMLPEEINTHPGRDGLSNDGCQGGASSSEVQNDDEQPTQQQIDTDRDDPDGG